MKMEEVKEQVKEEVKEQVIEQPKVDPQVEERAKIQGWVPKEEFRGDPTRWIPATDFVKRADEMMPILKSVNKKLETQVSELGKKLTDTRGMIEKMVKINEKYTDDFYQSRIVDIEKQKRKAAEDGNFDLYDRLEIQKTQIAKPEKIEVVPPSENHVDGPNPVVAAWVESNQSWWGVDVEMTNYAQYLGEQMAKNKDPLAVPGKEYDFCQKIERQLKKTFPTRFANPNQNRMDVDESRIRGGDNVDTKGKKSWNDLPQDAKAQCNKLLVEIPGYTKEKYLKDYFEGE
jgi:hypothetical protein